MNKQNVRFKQSSISTVTSLELSNENIEMFLFSNAEPQLRLTYLQATPPVDRRRFRSRDHLNSPYLAPTAFLVSSSRFEKTRK